MINYSLSIINNSTIATILYSICTLSFLTVPFIVYYIKSQNDTTLIQKYLTVFKNPDEAYAAYQRDKENLNIVEPYKTRSLISIIYYLSIFFIVSEFIGYIAILLYLNANGFSKDVITEGSSLFDPNVYDHMQSYLNLILQIIIYGIAIIGVLILMWKPLIEDFNRISGKTFAFGAMGLGITYAGSLIGSLFLSIIGVTNWKSDSSNQQAIDEMFSTSPLNLIILFVVIVIIAPILEELIFRKAIFKQFKKRNLALIVSSLSFGLLHVISSATAVLIQIPRGTATFLDFVLELIYVIPYSLMGIGMGIAYIKSSNNICAPIFTHMLNNFLSYCISVFLIFNPELLDLLEQYGVIFINFLF